MLKRLFEDEKRYLDFFFDNLNMEMAEIMLQAFLSCTGVIFFTGIGKSGIVAQKIAVTLVSTGTKALYLPPTDALHGDLGIVSPEDLFVFLSKSGESEELLQLIPYVRNKGARLIGVVSNPSSRLARATDLMICLPLERELCPFDLVPTTSTEIQLIFGDVLSIALMRAKNFGICEFAKNHPGGRLGKRMTILAQDLMLKDSALPVCTPSDKLIDVLVELSNKGCGCLLIVNEKKELLGIFTDGDLRRALQNRGVESLQETMGGLMNPKPKWTSPQVLAWEAMKIMEADPKHPFMVLPILDKGVLIGLVKMHDIIQHGI